VDQLEKVTVQRKLLFEALIVLGIAANLAFLFINSSPERPHLGRRRTVRVLLRAAKPRIDWMLQNEFSEYGRLHDLDFEFVSAASFEDAFGLLLKEKDHPTGLLLSDIDDEHTTELQEKGAVQPMSGATTAAALQAGLAEYIPEAVKRGAASGVQWFLPKSARVDVAVFLRPAVEEAYLNWEEDRPAIEAALREANGVGLPSGYQLEKSPEDWDTFDLFVAGWHWAHHPAQWAEAAVMLGTHAVPPVTAPRIGFPCGDNEDASAELLNSLYRHGATDATFMTTDAPHVLDTLQWRALFRKSGIVPAACEGEGMDTFAVNALIHERKLAWAPIDQEDSLWLHGGARREAPPGMAGAGDLAWATLPRGVSAELNERGEPARTGRSFSFEEVHLWAVPVHSPDPRLAFELASFIDQRGLQQRETESQGMLPIRNDLRQDYPVLFRLDWMQRMLDASFRQIDLGSGVAPADWGAKEYDAQFAKLLEAVVYSRPVNAPVTLVAIRAAVEEASHAR
jgi:hypothetical protein